MRPKNERSRQMVKRAVEGDTVALKVLLTEIQPQLAAYVKRKMPAFLTPIMDVDDLLVQAQAEVFRGISTFEPQGRDAFYRWVATIALNRLRNAIKRHRTAKRGGDWQRVSPVSNKLTESTLGLWDLVADSGPTPSRVVAKGEAVDAVHAALADLPEHYRQAIWLVHIEGRPVKKVALEMGRSERAIHGLCRRGMKLLQQHLQTASRFLSSGGGGH